MRNATVSGTRKKGGPLPEGNNQRDRLGGLKRSFSGVHCLAMSQKAEQCRPTAREVALGTVSVGTWMSGLFSRWATAPFSAASGDCCSPSDHLIVSISCFPPSAQSFWQGNPRPAQGCRPVTQRSREKNMLHKTSLTPSQLRGGDMS